MFEAYSTTTEAYTQNEPVAFPNIRHADSRIVQTNANTIILKSAGKYFISVHAVGASGTAATPFSIQIYRDGVPLGGTESTITSTLANEKFTLSADTLVQVRPSCCAIDNTPSITVVVTSPVAGSISSANITIMKLWH